MIPSKPSATTRRRYVRNIVTAYERSTDDQRARGATWYRNAHSLAGMIGDGNTRAAAGVIAALSANKSWQANQRLAVKAYATGKAGGHTRATLAKVARIMNGADPVSVLPMDAKTGHFFRCIADPYDGDAVCIDRHAHDVAVGRTHGNAERGLSSVARYAALAECYRTAAAKLHILPSTLQAVTWLVQVEMIAGTSTRSNEHKRSN